MIENAESAERPDLAVAELFTALARKLDAAADLSEVLHRTVTAAARNVPGAEHAGITVLTRKSAESPATTDELVRLLDQAQYATQQGPCLTAAADQADVVVVDDLQTDPRWPLFAAQVAAFGIASILSYRLFTSEDTIGALNIYASAPHSFDAESVRWGRMLAAHAALAMDRTRTVDHLTSALASRDQIGQAKGILMERYAITDDQAFELLIAASQNTNRKLRDIAADLAATGELPDPHEGA